MDGPLVNWPTLDVFFLGRVFKAASNERVSCMPCSLVVQLVSTLSEASPIR